ncbi:bifunctional glutamate N-acetyltransferase/amino-acid acetyltransferase ArgJ [Endozoicomonas sp. SM1973]|uniref:Arginine biosynthesis bifunctional protein ArgJ n=1 Tax=Spartinivicinus marinus TaxID=2994442 RepID=A0A853HZ62_9GAMM|nr:bifunctional glutamate N-acetyltransferase/amino-acid acetyltransferase ArgJ [Spartinivicinus marinus]MCX4028324.1 bifunctional glutamate N-acetyltransferase/amino-acid acetyltransferase ArgJ [Spartinivicinus marinus]NYZ65659.1 bifunctional glutamate N-acetyltransferase/amino-acid acetyltransferase ArgJ [Spartinivicinus marinus]
MAVGLESIKQLLPVPGVNLSAVSAGIKKNQRTDLALLQFKTGSTVAGVFTQNRFCAAPVQVAKQHLSQQPLALLINAGNANAGTGQQGLEDAYYSCGMTAEQLGLTQQQVLPFSTGVIGELFPIQKIVDSLPQLVSKLSDQTWNQVAEAIMTTDTQAKGVSKQFSWKGNTYTITGIAKGAGMIKPNMATMLAFIATDLAIDQALLQKLTGDVANLSFNRITIDGDTSTNDAFIVAATGAANNELIVDTNDQLFQLFKSTLIEVAKQLAQMIVRDGEGATKFVSINVGGAKTAQDALEVAYTVAHSPLVKTALFASDPNWGRILAAVGRAQIAELDVSKVQIKLNDVVIVENGGRAASYTEEQGQQAMVEPTIAIDIELGCGDLAETIWTTDLSHEYVKINAEYRT